MSTNLAENQDLRRYLLGGLTDETALQQIEERILAETEFQEEMAVAESALIDEYVLGALPANEVSSFERHFLAHPTRQAQLRLARALHAYAQENAPVIATTAPAVASPPKAGWFDWLLRPPVRAAAFAVLLLAVGLGVWRVFVRQSEAQRATHEIAAAFPQDGPLDVRVTGLALNPPPNIRGAKDSKGDAEKLRRADYILLEAQPDAAVAHAKGKLALVQKNYDEASKQLEAALKLNPDNAQLHADLGAALLTEARTLNNDDKQRLALLGKSYEHLKQALDRNGELLEARFNYALCLQEQTLALQASEAWQEYLKRDANSEWATRARSFLKELDSVQTSASPEQILQDFLTAYRQHDDERAWRILSQTREMITGRMVVLQLARKFLAAATEGRSNDAAGSLAAFTYAGEMEKAHGGDPFVADLANYYRRTDKNRQLILKQAQAEMDAGYQECLNSGSYMAAQNNFVQAKNLFSQADNICEAKIADFWIAYVTSESDKLQRTIDDLQHLAAFCRTKKYKWLAAQALGWIGDSYTLSNEISKALAVQAEALNMAGAVADTYNQQKLLDQFSLLYNQLGQSQRALVYNQASLSLAGLHPIILRQAWRNFTYTSSTFYRLKNYYAAAAFEEEALRLNKEKLHDPIMPYSSHLHLAAAYTELQQYTEAKQHADLCLQVAESRLPSEAARKQMIARAHLGLGELLRREGKDTESLTHYNQAIQLYDQLEFSLGKYEAHKGKLACALNANDEQTIQAELGYVLDLLKNNRKAITESQNRDSYFSSEQSAYDLAISYEYQRHNYPQAFAYAEDARARSLLDALQSGVTIKQDREVEPTLTAVTNPLSLAEVSAQMPPEVQTVQYTVLPEKLLIWFISANRYEVIEKNVKQADLSALVNTYLATIKAAAKQDVAQQTTAHNQALALYEVLLSPVAQWLEPKRDLCIIPDKSLTGLPFAALISPQSGNYLMSDFRVFSAPSASTLILLSQKARQYAPAGGETLLAIGNPAFSRKAYPSLVDLPLAAQEAQAVARNNYRNPIVLIGSQAQQESVQASLGQAEVLHFAGHYVADETAPLRSKLLLANDGEVPVYEVLQTKFRNTKLVTLSACETNAEHDGEGLIGLSRAFLAAGVPLVVASQWPVAESEATMVLMTKLHYYRATQHKSTNEALRLAQVDMLTYSEGRYSSPYYWAAFLPLGGYANF